MKRCPKCAEVYNDARLRFCRTDGVALVDFDREAPTAIFDSIPVTGAAIAEVSSRDPSAKSKSVDSIAVLPFENVGEDPNAEYLITVDRRWGSLRDDRRFIEIVQRVGL